MKQYRLKIDTPWAPKGAIYTHVKDRWDECVSNGFSFLRDPSKYPDLFEEIPEKSDQEILADWIRERFRVAARNKLYADIADKTLAQALIDHGFDVNKIKLEDKCFQKNK